MFAVVRPGERVGDARFVELSQEELLTLVRDRKPKDGLRSELDEVPVAEPCAFDALPRDERAVRRLRVFDEVTAFVRADQCVLAADAVVIEPNLALLRAPDTYWLRSEPRHVAELSSPRADQQRSILGLAPRASSAKARQGHDRGELGGVVVAIGAQFRTIAHRTSHTNVHEPLPPRLGAPFGE